VIYLPNTTDKIQLITGQAANLDAYVGYTDQNNTAPFALSGVGRQVTDGIATATTTDILAAPAASTIRNVKKILARNTHASQACDVTVQYNANTVLIELYKTTLNAGDTLEYVEGVGFFVLTAQNVAGQLTAFEASTGQRVAFSQLERAAVGTFVTVSGTAYFVYVGRTVKAVTVLFVESVGTGTVAAGTAVAEVGLFSTTNPPNKSAQTLTKIVATGTVDSFTTNGVKRNTASFAQAVAAGTHLWAALRTAYATTQPTTHGLAGDSSQGHVLTTTGGGALTALSTAAGTIPALGTATVAPDLRVTLD
jgi:hypothetical protein